MNNLTEQEAFNIADFINSYLFTAIKQDEINNIEWLATLIHGYEKLSEYCKYDECYDHSNEPEEDKIPWERVYWERMYWYLTSVPLFLGEYDAEKENGQFMYGVKTVMEYIAEKAGKAESFRSIFHSNMMKSLERAGKF